ncbi:hypothetical protein EP073_05870 [Geovibrio thiophilus]|uniref:Uncharacterized protein n=1 Tax=Geovibrio thiophilus TaxID=139438 RepID=A0A410JXQ9_9BACT|nr:hypothetical protein [Geovibrio thiophilus]QAR32950.1 hypothetical protein EP073_05870 [Geovibrio thiophilus]
MQVTAKSIMLEQYNKLLKNDSSSALQSAKESANPLLIGKSADETDSSTSVLDKVQISQAALDMLNSYSSEDTATTEAQKAALEKFFQLGSSYFGTEGSTNLEAVIAALEANIEEGDTDSLLKTIAESNRAANAGQGRISYNADVSALFE